MKFMRLLNSWLWKRIVSQSSAKGRLRSIRWLTNILFPGCPRGSDPMQHLKGDELVEIDDNENKKHKSNELLPVKNVLPSHVTLKESHIKESKGISIWEQEEKSIDIGVDTVVAANSDEDTGTSEEEEGNVSIFVGFTMVATLECLT